MAITTSCQPRPQPQATGTAATSARNGTATKRATRTRSKVLLGSGLMSGRARAGPRAGGASTVSGVAVRSVVAVIGVPRSLGGSADGWRAPSHTPGFRGRCKYAYVTVGYDTVGCARAGTYFLPDCREDHTCRKSPAQVRTLRPEAGRPGRLP